MTFLFLCREFFDQLNPNFVEEEEEDDNDIEKNREIDEMSEEIIKDLDHLSNMLKKIFFFMNFKKNKLE